MPPRKKSNKAKGSRKKAPVKKETKPAAKKEDSKMVDDEDKKTAKKEEKKEEKKKEPEVIEDIVDPKMPIRNEIKSTVLLILQAVENKDLLLFTRVTRHIHAIRKKQTVGLLNWTINKFCPELASHLKPYAKQIAGEQAEDKKLWAAMAAVEAAKKKKAAAKLAADKASEESAASTAVGVKPSEEDKDKAAKAAKEEKEKEAKEAEKKKQKEAEEAKKEIEAAKLAEVRAMVQLLVCMFLVDQQAKETSAACVEDLLAFIQGFNRRTLDALSAKVFYLYALTQERLGHLGTIRNQLLQYHRTAALHHNEPAQATLVVAILRSFLSFKLYQQADKFRLNTAMPESANNDQHARYLYYLGQINAVQLQYSDAYTHLTMAVRKAPQTGALGFRQTAHKLLVIVQLLMGEIPERTIFIAGDLVPALKPYFKLTQAVRVGHLPSFETVVAAQTGVWERDGLTSLVGRLRNNVIKTGLRMINLSYSRIALSDVASKLNLDSVQDAEHIVAKCIHDGVIDAVLDHKDSFMYSKERGDKYATYGPQGAFHKRIVFCMDIHNDAVKALRFPPNAHKAMLDEEPPLEDDEVELEADSMDDD